MAREENLRPLHFARFKPCSTMLVIKAKEKEGAQIIAISQGRAD
jgi:hypothetical protein